jgi:GWxTD domain-containing protein
MNTIYSQSIKMKNKKLILLVFLLTVPAFTQVENRRPDDVGAPKFFVDALGFISSKHDSSRLDIYTQVTYEGISFVKDASIYTASYELTIDIYDAKKNLVTEKILNETIKTSNYDETVSPKSYKLTQQSFDLPPDKYVVSVQVRDNETGKPFSVKRDVELRNFHSLSFAMSDIMILNKLTAENGKKSIVPNISGNVAELNNSFHVFFEAYNNANLDSVKILAFLYDEKEKFIKTDTSYDLLKSGTNSVFVKINTTNLPMEAYILKINMSPMHSDQPTAEVKRKFNIQWRGMPHSFVDLDAAIDQMIYIFDQKEIDKIKILPPEKKVEAFKQLWKTKDPTPGTDRNELMDEYYSRVEYANKNFKHYLQGWRTDMGMVFIIFGSPNNVDRHPFDIDAKPYEVWYYYQLNRQLVFVDETGFGDYHLVTPIWDVWQRPQ